MSSYEKPQESYVYGYNSTRLGQEQTYAGPTQPSYGSQYPSSQVGESHALVSSHQMPYLDQSFEPRDTSFQANPAALIAARTRPSPEITSTGPYTGRPGETFCLSVRSKVDYTTRNYSFTILFGSTAAAVSLIKNFYRDPYHHYTLQTTVPPYRHSDPTQQSAMPLLLGVQDENGQSLGMKSLDTFTYLDNSPFSTYTAPLEVHKKRNTTLQPRSQGAFAAVPEGNAFTYESGGLFTVPAIYERSISQQRPYATSITQRPSYAYPGSPPRHSGIKGRSPSLGAYGVHSSTSRPSPSPRMSATPQDSRSHGEANATPPSNPPLIRTSILQPQATSSFRTPGFNPYAIYPSAKAELDIQGELISMADFPSWTNEEKKAKRRLVEFHRRQEDSIIRASFKPVTVEERTQGAHCVSCIFWEERGECFVTSVDAIQLLEGLVGVRFTVEEKNRIRRNLEGFKPLTVSKQKEDSESFFRLIMGFPNPKPRNIEKDVKVFPWSILSSALKKIIGKYSASYASTSAILTPSTTAGFAVSIPEAVEHVPSTSPRSTTSSSASQSYQVSTILSSNVSSRAAIDVTSSPYEPVRQTSQAMTAIGHWAPQYPSSANTGQYTNEPGALSGRSSWDMSDYGEQQQLPNAPPYQMHYFQDSTPPEHVQPSRYPAHSQAHS
ncbi:hypothetical protein, variant 2 [Verruconis gallopava]|uniref:DUF7082 domain-containing protein n=1 Tax=Verruconis gallopava TaxID=253628 RepID=A0A0D1Y1L1_9PEZI|nr:hypothetical protein, variant 2 [Verruconis gallopava]KIW08951.1 hypothetical protein, variant 2 [Verruconis gallopava]